MMRTLFLLAVINISNTLIVVNGLSEPERIEEYYKRYPHDDNNNHWPPKDYLPNTDGWTDLLDQRFQQLYQIKDYNQRYEGFLQTVFPAFLAPNFTEYGFGIAQAPAALTTTLQQAVRQALQSPLPLESEDIGVIEGPRAWFYDRPDLMDLVLKELHPLAEAWIGGGGAVPLHPHEAYGFRIYQNQSQLAMHVDKKETHVVSIIYHIDRSEDAQPWPIYIEDFRTGQTHEVLLERGEMLFYESAKCLHGRPTVFDGTYFTSVFVHYTPLQHRHWPFRANNDMESHYIIPPNWWNRNRDKDPENEATLVGTIPSSQKLPKIEMLGTCLKEPTCPNGWCATQNAIGFSSSSHLNEDGNGHVGMQEGYWIDPAGKKHPLKPTATTRKDDEL